ncbi:MAG: glycosyltransferase family 4 protein [Planctomycetota bacterium]
MHVLFLSDNFPPETNAPASRLHEHAKRWVEAGHRVTVITCAPNFPGGRVFDGYENRWHSREQVDGIEVVRVKTFIVANRGFLLRTLDYLSFMVAAFVAGLFQKRPDVVVATSPQFFAACGGWALAAVRRLPFVFELRDIWPASLEAVGASRSRPLIRFFERIELFLYRRAKAIIAVTRAFKEELVARGVDASKIHVVTNGVDQARYTPQKRDPELARAMGIEGKFVVGYVGTHGMAHALENCLAAAERLGRRSNVHLLFVGDGAAREALVEQKERLRLDNVTLHPPLAKERMPAIWGLCDVALVHLRDAPLFETVIPSKLFEAMGMGLPVVIACPEGEATGIVRATGCGRVVPPEDPDALATCLDWLSKDPATMRRLRERSLAAAMLYGRDRLASEMLEHLVAAAGLAPAKRLAAAPRNRAAA